MGSHELSKPSYEENKIKELEGQIESLTEEKRLLQRELIGKNRIIFKLKKQIKKNGK